jgi:hypothetical protein
MAVRFQGGAAVPASTTFNATRLKKSQEMASRYLREMSSELASLEKAAAVSRNRELIAFVTEARQEVGKSIGSVASVSVGLMQWTR